MSACNRKDQPSDGPITFNSPAAPAPEGAPIPQAQVLAFWNSFADTQVGVSSESFQMPTSPETSIFASVNSSLNFFYDPLDGSTLGIPNIAGYGPGFLAQSAVFGGNHHYIQYSAGSQIPNSGPVEFYLNISAYQPAYNGMNIIFTQPGYGGAAQGDVHCALLSNNTVAFGQWGPGWHYSNSPPLPMNQWVKIRAEFGSTGKNLYFNDQLVSSDQSIKIPISTRPFYFGTRAFYGPEYGINGKLDEVYGGTIIGSLKIASPTTGNVFAFGENINFIGSKTGTVTNIEWLDNGVAFGQGLSISKNDLSPGSHTITLRGLSAGNSVSDSITIGIRKPEIRVWSLNFQKGAGTNNLNRLYDRMREYKTSGDKLLEPTQWQGHRVGNDIVQDFNYPVSYVRDGAPSLGGLPSRLSLMVDVTDLNNTPGQIDFEAHVTGKLFKNGVPFSDLSFPVETVTATQWPHIFTTQSTSPLPNEVGIWDLELTFTFKKGAITIGGCRTPQAGSFHRIFTTWEKPLTNGYFFQDEESKRNGPPKVEETPTYYLELAKFSCDFSRGANSSTSEDALLTQLFNNAWSLSSQGYKYDAQTPVSPGVTPRGLDSLLLRKTGWCEEWSTFFKALVESQGVNGWYQGFRLTPEQTDILGYRLYLTNRNLPALGGDIQNPEPRWWSFRDHAYNKTNQTFYDLSFNGESPSEETYINNNFDLVIYPTRDLVTSDPYPADIHIYLSYD